MFFVLQVVFAWSQEKTSSVTGKVVDSKTQKPLESVVATIQNTTLTALIFNIRNSSLILFKYVLIKRDTLLSKTHTGKRMLIYTKLSAYFGSHIERIYRTG